MKTVTRSIEEAIWNSKRFDFYFSGLKVGILDIETTGLSAERCKVILGGLLTIEKDAALNASDAKSLLTVHQYFAEGYHEECAVLDAYAKQLSTLDAVISYNGDSFDLPFLRKRLNKNNLPDPIPHLQSFDLYRILSRSSLSSILPDLKQKTVEHYLGLVQSRTDLISGGESVALYEEYAKKKDPRLEKFILLHNSDDLLQLCRILPILDTLDLHRAMLRTGFIVCQAEKKLILKKIELKKSVLQVVGLIPDETADYMNYSEGFQTSISAKTGEFLLKLPVVKEKGVIYLDLEDFPFNFSELEKYPAFQSGFLVIKNGDQVNCSEINHFLKLICTEILREI